MTNRRAAAGVVVSGHGAASGRGSRRYPDGTLALQIPIFAELGLDLSDAFPGTINVDTAPYRFVPGTADHVFTDIAWTDRIPPESFSFHRCSLSVGGRRQGAWLYRPHPETKVEHLQPPGVVECISHHIDGLEPGWRVEIELAPGRGSFA